MAGSILGAKTAASALDSRAKIRRSQGDAALSRAEAQASRTRETAKKNTLLAIEQMSALRDNQRLAQGAARAQASTSGFTSQGSGDAVADAVRAAYDEQISNMALSASIESMNAEQAAIDTVRQGQLEQMAAYGEADQMRREARATRRGLWWSGAGAVGGLISGISGMMGDSGGGSRGGSGSSSGGSSGSGFSWGKFAQGAKDLYGVTSAGFYASSIANPYMSKYLPSGWENSFWQTFQQKKK